MSYKIQAFYERFLKTGDLVYDVGANIGIRTEVFRNIGCSVVSVEPHKSCVLILQNKFINDDRISIVPKALGSRAGIDCLITGDATCFSSLSPRWIDAVTKTNRFDGYKWTETQSVEVITLDNLISIYGLPVFVKIDVEGFEYEVLAGLSHPVKMLSFEFTPEYLDSAEKCISHLESLGVVRFTYSVQETMEIHPEWVSGKEILKALKCFVGDSQIYGDIYARFL